MTTGSPKLDALIAALPDLAKDRTAQTCEQHAPNDYYGHATMLKRYAGLPAEEPLRLSIQHGIRLDLGYWEHDFHPGHAIGLVHSQWRANVVEPLVKKRMVPIGPYTHYSTPLFSAEETASIRAELGRTLLVFPSHSTHWIDVDYDFSAFCEQLTEAGRDFKTTLVCLYWKDVLRGAGEEYARRGFPCVTAGHIYDLEFMRRLHTYLDLADVTLGNDVGSHLGYSLHLGKPHRLLDFAPTRRAMNAERAAESPAKVRLEIPRYFSLFSGPQERITDEQRDFVGKYWGFGSEKTPGQMAALAQEAVVRRESFLRRRAWKRKLGPFGRFISDRL